MLSFVFMASMIGVEPPPLDGASVAKLQAEVTELKARVARLESSRSSALCPCGIPGCQCGCAFGAPCTCLKSKPAAKTTTAPTMQLVWEAVPVTSCSRRGGCQTTYEYRQVYRSVQAPVRSTPVVLAAPVPTATTSETTVKEKRNKTVIKTRTTSVGLDRLNRQRAQRGLRPYIFDEGLTQAAERVASTKAAGCISGHINDFAYLPPGVQCAATGADGSKIHASDPNFYTCAMYDNYTYAGAAVCLGPDNNQYFSLFVR